MSERAPTVAEVAAHLERRMAGKTGSVTLHFADGRLKRIEIRTMEDARDLPRSA